MKLAAIRYGPNQGATVDELLVGVAECLRAQQVRVCGAIQRNENNGDRRCDGMRLEDLATGRSVMICDSVPNARADCRLDETALAEAIAWADSGLNAGADILIVNKFGKREAFGRGFKPTIHRAVTRGIPAIAGVGDRNADAWNAAFGHRAVNLQADHEIVFDWCLNNVALRTA